MNKIFLKFIVVIVVFCVGLIVVNVEMFCWVCVGDLLMFDLYV